MRCYKWRRRCAFLQHHKTSKLSKLQNSTILTVAVVTFRFSKNFTIACHRSTPSPFSPICDRQTFQISSLYAIEKGPKNSDFSSEISCNKNLRTSKSPIPWISSDDVTDYDSVQNSLPKVHKNSSLLWDVRRQIVNDQLKPTMFDILQSDCVNLQQHLRFSTTVT